MATKTKTTHHPIQPLALDASGVLRFKENKIVDDLLSYSRERGFGLNEIAVRDYTREDRQQLAQLIGYSLSGYGELTSYVDDDAYGIAERMANGAKDERDAEIKHLRAELKAIRDGLRKPVARLFGVHPTDLDNNLF